MRIHHEPIAVNFDVMPRHFIWRGKLLKVTRVLATWTRCLPWWLDMLEDPEANLLVEQQWWRCEAGTPARLGVYDLVYREDHAQWRLWTVMD